MKKYILSTLCVLTMGTSIMPVAKAEDIPQPIPNAHLQNGFNTEIEFPDFGIETHAYGVRREKSNVRRYTEWSSIRRISDNVSVGPKGGSISSNRVTTFGTSITGSVPTSGVSVNTTASVSSSIGYTLHVTPNRRAYLGYRVLYDVEAGTETMKGYEGDVLNVNNYVVKSPRYGEYILVYQ